MRFTEYENPESNNLEWLIRKDGCMPLLARRLAGLAADALGDVDELGDLLVRADRRRLLTPKTWTLMRFTEYENPESNNLEWLIRKDGCMHCTDPGGALVRLAVDLGDPRDVERAALDAVAAADAVLLDALMRFTEYENPESNNLEWLIRKDGCMHCTDPGCLRRRRAGRSTPRTPPGRPCSRCTWRRR
jgi:hypothetical protein